MVEKEEHQQQQNGIGSVSEYTLPMEQKILSDITTFMKYARYEPSLMRRETWEELVDRNKKMHLRKFPELSEEIENVYENFVKTKKVVPSMRSLQFAGPAIELANQRIYNCSFHHASNIDFFSETLLLLLQGAGVGFSVQRHHVECLPPIKRPTKYQRFLIGDSIAGWADSVKVLMRAFLDPSKKTRPRFDFRDIREKGAPLITSGGKAPGPEPLKVCLTKIEAMLENKQEGTKLTPLEVHDIACHLADAVLAGGIRRAAMISLFSPDDHEMMACKTGNWWEMHPQRARANNSVVFNRNHLTKESFDTYWNYLVASNSGEPGFFLTNDSERGTNPCLAGDTLVPLADGSGEIKTLKEIADSGDDDVMVYSLDDDGELTIRKLRGTQITKQNAVVYKVTLDNGQEIKATSNHRLRLKDGLWKTVGEIEAGDSLWIASQYENQLYNNPNSQKYRWVSNQNKKDCEHRLIARDLLNDGTPIKSGYVVHHKDYNALNNHYENLEIMTKEAHDKLHSFDKIGEKNPIHKILNDPERRGPYIQKLSLASKGLKNGNSKNVTNEEIFQRAVEFCESIGRKPLQSEWQQYAKDNGIPIFLGSDFRKDGDLLNNILVEAAIKANVLPEEYKDVHPHTLNALYRWQERDDYTVKLSDDKKKVLFLNHCEVKGIDFWSENPYRRFSDGVTSSEIQKHFYEDPAHRIYMKQRIVASHKERKEKVGADQVEVFNALKFSLGREPSKNEWKDECKSQGISPEISRKSSPFRYWNDLKDAALYANHKVVSVEYCGVEDVYDGIVNDTHNYFLLGSKLMMEKTDNGKIDKYTFVNSSQCAEIALKNHQFCNLSSINGQAVKTQDDLIAASKAASFIGTLQSAYNDFYYLSPEWEENALDEPLLGVSITGWASGVHKYDLEAAAKTVIDENKRVSKMVGVKTAARQTCVKPEGTSASVLGSASGVHPWHAKFYVRRIRVNKNESIYDYLVENHPELIEDEFFDPEKTAVISIPMKAPDGAITRSDETAIEFLERVKDAQTRWVSNGHVSGANTHNVSSTVNVKEHEWTDVREWIWENRNDLTAVSCFPYSDPNYPQLPFEEITEERYDELAKNLSDIDLTKVVEEDPEINHGRDAVACAGGACEI